MSAAGRRAVTHSQEHTDENVTLIEPHTWPPNSPDLNSDDYTVWVALQQMVYQRWRFTTINQLKQTIVTEWDKLLQHSHHWSLASPAWVGRPAARRTNWTFVVKNCSMWVTLGNNWDNKYVNFFKMCCYRSRLFSNVALKTPDNSQGSVATHLRCSGIFSDSIISYFLLILAVK